MRNNKYLKLAAALVFWLAVWQIASIFVGQKILLPSPLDAVKSFFTIVFTAKFLSAVGFTVSKILSGFFLALIASVVLVIISSVSKFAKAMISPLMSALKSVPVASFVILALIWINSAYLSAFICFVMVLPVLYINILSGIESTPSDMKDMAKIYNIKPVKKALYIFTPNALPYFKSGCKIALGLCWKAGVAAELIGIPTGSVGEQLYFSKVYFLTSDLFAWTLVIILISVLFEKLFMYALGLLTSLYERI
ncbi:MAG: ABC transporter permease subunit [Clostridia bacterium]|nr:ABC transporter permease subunit [Clostridia bacterium]